MWHDARLLNNLANALFGMVLAVLIDVWRLVGDSTPGVTLQSIRVEAMSEQGLKHVNALTIRNTAIPKIRGNFYCESGRCAVRLKAYHG
jgi:cell division protein FtsQ